MSEEQTINGQAQEAEPNEKSIEEPKQVMADAGTAEKASTQQEGQPQETKVDESADSEIELTAEQRIGFLESEVAKAKEDVLRAQAEAQNARRRSEADVEKARKFALERFVGDLLPVIDNLDRALDAIDGDDEAFKSVIEGIELTRKSFHDTLSKNHVVQIDPIGEPFDPENHQAMSMVPNPDAEPNTVMDVFQKGYSLNGRLIRPAMVIVTKAPE